MGITPLRFTGISDFSDDFQAILDRAVAIARLPIQRLQQEQAQLLAKKQALNDLRQSVALLASALENLAQLGERRALAASSSNTSIVTVSLNGASSPASYTLSEISSIARPASETTISGYSSLTESAVSADGVLEFRVGAQRYTLDLTALGQNNLAGLRDAINRLNAGVTANILNTGDPDRPYYLVVTASNTGEQPLQLLDDPNDPGTNLLTANNPGSNAVFKLNGLTVTRATNTISDVIPGVTLTLLRETTGTESVTISLNSSRTQVANALSSLVNAYNSLRTQLSAQMGKNAGPLSGDVIVRQLAQYLRELATYELPSGPIRRLADFGIQFNDKGEMSFDSAKFYALSQEEFQAVLDFLGSKTSGLGGFAQKFSEVSDPVRGWIKTQQDHYDAADARLNQQIEVLSERLQRMQQSLLLKLEQADSLLAQLEGQQAMLDAAIKGLNLVLYGRRES